MSENKLFDLANTEFPITFAGKEYTVRKAHLGMAITYQKKLQELAKSAEPGMELRLAAYCLFLVLNKVDSTITEEFVLENVPGDIDVLGIIQHLGFMSPQMRAEQFGKVENPQNQDQPKK